MLHHEAANRRNVRLDNRYDEFEDDGDGGVDQQPRFNMAEDHFASLRQPRCSAPLILQRELSALRALEPDLAIEADVGSQRGGQKPNGNSCRQ